MRRSASSSLDLDLKSGAWRIRRKIIYAERRRRHSHGGPVCLTHISEESRSHALRGNAVFDAPRRLHGTSIGTGKRRKSLMGSVPSRWIGSAQCRRGASQTAFPRRTMGTSQAERSRLVVNA